MPNPFVLAECVYGAPYTGAARTTPEHPLEQTRQSLELERVDRRRVSLQARRAGHTEREQVVRAETRLHRMEVAQCSREQTGRREQDDRERDFGHDERAPCPRGAASRRRVPRAILECIDEHRASEPPRGPQTDDEPRERARAEGDE